MSGFTPDFGPAGPDHRGGAVPDPGPTAGLGRFLSDDGTFEVPGTQAPAAPAGGTTAQQSCNIGGYLAHAVIKRSISQAVDSINNDESVINYGVLIISLIPDAGLLINAAIKGLYALYTTIAGGTLSDYSDAVGDDALWSSITCAIYEAISGDGHVDATNFPTLVTNVGAVSYTHAEVITTIVDFLNQMGAAGLQGVQPSGALAVYDCSGCGGGSSTGPTDYPALHPLKVSDGTHVVTDVNEILFRPTSQEY